MGLLIDSNVLIAAERGLFSLPDWATTLPDTPMALSAITASELLHGVHRAKEPSIAQKRLRFVEYILDLFPVIPFDLQIARVHAQLWADLQTKGQSIGAHDLLIAATARTLDYGVVTGNEREFRRIPGLQVVKPF